MTTNSQQIATLKAQLNAANSTIAGNNATIASLTSQLGIIQNTLAAANKEIARLNTIISPPVVPIIPPTPLKHLSVASGPLSGQVTAQWDFTASRIDRNGGTSPWGMDSPTSPLTFWNVVDGEMVNVKVVATDGSILSASAIAGAAAPVTPPVVVIPPVTPSTGGPLAWIYPFGPASIWKQPTGSGITPISSNDPKATTLASQGGGTINCMWYSHPVYKAKSTDPMSTVHTGATSVQYNIPVNAQPANGTDAHMHVVDPTGRWVDEVWDMKKNADGTWNAGYHVRTDLLGPGYGQGGVRAYGGSAIGGLIRADELAAGHINHALAIALGPESLGPTSNPFVFPAITQDGDYLSSYTGHIPMGSFIYIPATTSLAGLTGDALTFAVALRDFGGYVTDRSSGLTFYVEPTNSIDTNRVNNIQNSLSAIVPMLRIAVTITVNTIGGGGTPRITPPPTTPQVG